MIILGIESSCDETAAAVVDSDKNILSNIIFSQINTHKEYGGVVPEVAARSHAGTMPYVIEKAISKAKVTLNSLDGIACVTGPGLYGGLLVGAITAKTMCFALNKPFISVNHLEAHILTPRLVENIPFPYLALLISGGHTQFVAVLSVGKYKILGTTLDDALGEAFDKTARLLGYAYPGGKHIEELAKNGSLGVFSFKPPLLYAKNCNFSFSGLKTAVSQKIQAFEKSNSLDFQTKADIAKAFETAILTVLRKKTCIAIQKFKEEYGSLNNFVVSGGVAANKNIRLLLSQISLDHNATFCAPPINLCGDNAAMVAWAGVERLKNNLIDSLKTIITPNFNLEDVKN